MLIALNKPYGYLSQFSPEPGSDWRVLAELGLPKNVYPIGRLDADSEGLILLSDEKSLVDKLLSPKRGHPREYWAQVERVPSEDALANMKRGLLIGDYKTLPCKVRILVPTPDLPARIPPIRFRKNVPDCWLSLELVEGKNRQVRKMTAAIGHPTLRLVRVRIGGLFLPSLNLAPGEWRELNPQERSLVLNN